MGLTTVLLAAMAFATGKAAAVESHTQTAPEERQRIIGMLQSLADCASPEAAIALTETDQAWRAWSTEYLGDTHRDAYVDLLNRKLQELQNQAIETIEGLKEEDRKLARSTLPLALLQNALEDLELVKETSDGGRTALSIRQKEAWRAIEETIMMLLQQYQVPERAGSAVVWVQDTCTYNNLNAIHDYLDGHFLVRFTPLRFGRWPVRRIVRPLAEGTTKSILRRVAPSVLDASVPAKDDHLTGDFAGDAHSVASTECTSTQLSEPSK